MPATITLADVHGSIETYEVENSLFMQIWDLLHDRGHKVDKLRLPEVMVIKDKHYGQPGYVKPNGFKAADDIGLQVRSTLDEFIAPIADKDVCAQPEGLLPSDDQDLPATTVVPEYESKPTQSENSFNQDFMTSLAKLMQKTK